ncbi:hypothetical protein PPERSA_10298 [Pseudocohnilembus persalinus]|uniref:Uncharacterized protein n=1 Tax=Pseudocohnilembus persalinus TaxID=266149 RepID=A0A0V0R043_PSEPJ|nr:hypothetical protein PPERSA_10298 [Pseudocohnilembus persalinus]|eukprot:KRX07910.1 hypothetical protein PPERSA_10298 [Pseudocohnilembus persalinus]
MTSNDNKEQKQSISLNFGSLIDSYEQDEEENNQEIKSITFSQQIEKKISNQIEESKTDGDIPDDQIYKLSAQFNQLDNIKEIVVKQQSDLQQDSEKVMKIKSVEKCQQLLNGKKIKFSENIQQNLSSQQFSDLLEQTLFIFRQNLINFKIQIKNNNIHIQAPSNFLEKDYKNLKEYLKKTEFIQQLNFENQVAQSSDKFQKKCLFLLLEGIYYLKDSIQDLRLHFSDKLINGPGCKKLGYRPNMQYKVIESVQVLTIQFKY